MTRYAHQFVPNLTARDITPCSNEAIKFTYNQVGELLLSVFNCFIYTFYFFLRSFHFVQEFRKEKKEREIINSKRKGKK